MNIYNRNTYEGKFLKKEDFLNGLGFDNQLIRHFLNKRKENNEYNFHHETSTAIDGTLRVKKYHPLLNKIIVDTRDGEEGIIESVHKHWYNGNYWVLVFRKEGTKSHGTLWYKNENSIDNTILESIEDTRKNWKFKDNFSWNEF